MRYSRKKIPVLWLMVLGVLSAAVFFHGFRVQGPDSVYAADATPQEDDGQGQKEADQKGEQQSDPCPECPECPDPAKVVLRGLEEKKQAIAEAQKILDEQRKELETYETQIDEKLEELTTIKKQITEDMARLEKKKTQQQLDREATFEAKMDRLVKMYAGMKPKKAALIVDKMELGVAQEIFLRMREASAAQILSFVDSAKAAKISERLAFRKK